MGAPEIFFASEHLGLPAIWWQWCEARSTMSEKVNRVDPAMSVRRNDAMCHKRTSAMRRRQADKHPTA